MAIPDQVAQTVADKIMIEFIAVFGVPTQLHTDQGRHFESHLLKQVCDLLGIHKTRPTPFHAQSDGQVERWNRTIQQMLKGVPSIRIVMTGMNTYHIYAWHIEPHPMNVQGVPQI